MEKSGKWLDLLLRNVSLILFVAILGVLYIANVHVAERKQLRIEERKKEVQRIKWQYMGIEKELLLNSAPSEMEKKMDDLGLKHAAGKPKNIHLDEPEKK